MIVWVEDLKFHFGAALRAAGIGLAAVAWASVLGSEAQQNADIRSYAQVAAAVISVCIAQVLTGLPPSANLPRLLREFERDIVAVVREQARADADRREILAARVNALAAERIRHGINVPRERRHWFRLLARLGD